MRGRPSAAETCRSNGNDTLDDKKTTSSRKQMGKICVPQQFHLKRRKEHRQNTQCRESGKKSHETFYKTPLNCNTCYILLRWGGERSEKMAKKRRKTCEIVDNFSTRGNFPVAFLQREQTGEKTACVLLRLTFVFLEPIMSDKSRAGQAGPRRNGPPGGVDIPILYRVLRRLSK